MDRIDLRSDTVTVPTDEMRRAMASASVGDDGYGEDPTVNELQQLAASMLGKEEALFFPSGTMANQAAILAHTQRGQGVILDSESHIYYYEAGGVATLAGCLPLTFQSNAGLVDPDQIISWLRPPNLHYPEVALLCLENTHNRAGGTIMDGKRTAALAELAHKHGLKVHLDGARIFNAAVALGVPVRELVEPVDSVMVSLSKGLGAPMGSLLAGTKEFIQRARRARKLLGGGMRQAGIVAAAGIVALRTMIDRLHEDHAHARSLALGLAEIPGLAVDLKTVQTNIVMVDVSATGLSAEVVATKWAEVGVLVNVFSPIHIRCVTHKDISAAQIDGALSKIARAMA